MSRTRSNAVRSLVELERAFGVKEVPVRVTRQTVKSRLAALERRAAACTDCSLYQTRTKLVFGDGPPNARLVFVGEAPGRDEDVQGVPFVGRAGQLLNKMIEAMGLKREDVYICNVLKDRPPDNRAPQPTEVAACRHWLEEQISIIQPQVICTLGKHASAALLDPEIAIMKARGTWMTWQGVPTMPTLHPAYLLRNPPAKKLVWNDLKAIRDRLKKSS
jgi:uracil-DNA glycosylase